jgi:hypothetical protein
MTKISFLAYCIGTLSLVLLLDSTVLAECGCCDPKTPCPKGGTVFCQGDCTCSTSSPIIVDTTGKGFRLTSAEDGVMFDIAGDGHPIKMAWTAADSGDAFLALDRNHNGKIDDGKELFGNFTVQAPCPDGGGACRNGYRALAEFDKPENGGNGDGIIDHRDAVFPRLLLWIDENHDGISQPNELHTLEELGVYSLSLQYKEARVEDQFGNIFHLKGVVNPDREDGESNDGRWDYDVFFAVDDQGRSTRPSTRTRLSHLRQP